MSKVCSRRSFVSHDPYPLSIGCDPLSLQTFKLGLIFEVLKKAGRPLTLTFEKPPPELTEQSGMIDGGACVSVCVSACARVCVCGRVYVHMYVHVCACVVLGEGVHRSVRVCVILSLRSLTLAGLLNRQILASDDSVYFENERWSMLQSSWGNPKLSKFLRLTFARRCVVFNNNCSIFTMLLLHTLTKTKQQLQRIFFSGPPTPDGPSAVVGAQWEKLRVSCVHCGTGTNGGCIGARMRRRGLGLLFAVHRVSEA